MCIHAGVSLCERLGSINMSMKPLSLLRTCSPTGIVAVGSSAAVGTQEAGGQLLLETLPCLDTRYCKPNAPACISTFNCFMC